MSNGYIGGAKLPPISQEFIDTLDAAFPSPDVRPGADRDELMYKAGQREVVEWVKHHASIKSTPDPVSMQRAVVRYGSA